MTVLELIGKTASAYLGKLLAPEDASEGTARFLLDRLTGEQVASVCREILANAEVADLVRIRVPRELGEPHDLAAELLTDERTTHWRHAACDRPALLIANTEDDQGQSLRDITPIGSLELLGESALWVQQASADLGLTEPHLRMWVKALKGLQDARPVSLDVFANYVIATRQAIATEAMPPLSALGWAFPALRVPRDSAFFEAIPERFRAHAHRWKRLFTQAFSKRAVYLTKLTPTQQPILQEQLQENWEKVRDDVPSEHHPTVKAFVDTPGRWTSEAAALANLEWERDNISALFAGLRARRVPLGQMTFEFYEDVYPDTLTDQEEDYLRRLDARRTRDANEEDEEFYEHHRAELNQNRSLKTRWDKFVFGQPIETDDFLVGLLKSLERLFEQAGPVADSRHLTIESNRKTPREWLDLNFRAASYFSRRYRGLRNLTSRGVHWDVGEVFRFERIVQRRRDRGRFQPTRSASKVANQVKFYVTLETKTGESTESHSVQLIWRFNSHSICAEYASDWERLLDHSCVQGRVAREPVSKKGRLQAIDMSDVSTLMPVFRQSRGSLIAAYSRGNDLELSIPESLEQALRERRLTPSGHTEIRAAWMAFTQGYRQALGECFEDGVSATSCLEVEPLYLALLQSLIEHAPGDKNKQALWQPILAVGLVPVDGGSPAAIVAPWHPLRLVGMAVRARQVGGLIRHLVSADLVDFGDARLFFEDLGEELKHPYYPEVCLGILGNQPSLLSRSDAVGDYTLMEPPVSGYAEEDSTNENPAETSKKIVSLVKRYLELLPHERANLSVVLYNCNSARLPEATVNALSVLHDSEDEVRCQVILRHNDSQKLHALYETIVEGADGASDGFAGSEASRDFMARLRIGIMADAAPISNASDGPPIDLVFLQDVIARLAEQTWVEEPSDTPEPQILHHVPSRQSRRRPGTVDDLRSVVYLACPIQPSVGWRYLQALHGVVTGEQSDPQARLVPARQISFQHNVTQHVFDDVHRLGQWVVNSDDLLTRRQLRNQGVQVIRYQQQRYGGRSLIVSSKAPLTLLEVMVQRRLQSLNVGLDGEELRHLTKRLVNDASEISGDIVLRAAKRGQFASELVGLVLSQYLLQDELGSAAHKGWYFLDDYAAWLGQKEQHLADIMVLSPNTVEEETQLTVLISEAKYVTRGGLADARRSSAVQLRETTSRINEALFGNPGRLDRDLWLGRLADMILDGIEVPATEGLTLHAWRDGIRLGNAKILLKGFSHVFIHTQEADESDPTERTRVTGAEHCWQEIYGREQVRRLLLAYHNGTGARELRAQLDDDHPWDEGEPTPPSRRVDWVAVPRPPRPPGPKGGTTGEASRDQRVQVEAPAPREAATVSSHTERTANESQDTISGQDEFCWAASNQRDTLGNLATAIPDSTVDSKWATETVAKLRTALLSYGLQAKVLAHRLTPNAALVRFQGSDRLRTSDVVSRSNELLTTHRLQITNVLAEPGEVVVSVARPNRQVVSLVDAWRNRHIDSPEFRANQSLLLGVRESDGEMLYLSPGGAHAPHSLIAGTTGSGKSVLIQNLLLDIASTNDCNSARIVLIDPKQGTDYFEFQSLPHIQGEIIVSQDQAREALESAVAEMERRYELFRARSVQNLAQYNLAVPAEERRPVLWLFHDEFAVWMLVEEYKDTVSSTVQRLGVMARAAGIFLVFAAQRPEDRVMPVQLRDNLGNRLVLRVESPGTSKIALGEEGAERLLGKGHLAARLQNEDNVVLAQVPILIPDEIRAIISAIRLDNEPENPL